MTYVVITVAFAIIALLLLAVAARGQVTPVRTVDELLATARAVDLEAFRNLTDPAETGYLRSALSRDDFRSVQRERMRAAAEYTGRTAYNAALLMRVGAATRNSKDAKVAEAAASMMNDALQLRLLSLAALAKFRLATAFPDAVAAPTTFTDRYERLRSRAGTLTRLQRPSIASRVLSAL